MGHAIPSIDVGPLFGGPSQARDHADRQIAAAAADSGFFVAIGLPSEIPLGAAARADLLRIFALPQNEIRRLWRQKFDPSNSNVYRGWFPLQNGFLTRKEGIDMGPDVAYGCEVVHPGDPLREPTPLPPEEALGGWRASVSAYYRAMERTANSLMHSIARGLGLGEGHFDAAFARGGLSTLRLIHYPPRTDLAEVSANDPGVWVDHAGERRYVMGAPHVDSGFLTLLAQDGVAGLQARHHDGAWVDVPPLETGLAVNFGRVLERWCGGRIKATEHRVIGTGQRRHSIPFFYEAGAEAQIAPLPIAGSAPFEPFLFGDYLWATTTQFVEFRGMEALRTPLRARA
ncbi:MAG: isopenicillin N synthase family oxygenase [Gammaproteobacteria bacterium]|nr:isopenicillin N synthase family oxygenase [Gammaproteobacteria bacterium]